MKKIFLFIITLVLSFTLVSCKKSESYDVNIIDNTFIGNTYTYTIDLGNSIIKDDYQSIGYSTASNIYKELKEDINNSSVFLIIDFKQNNKKVLTLKYHININELKPGLNLIKETLY